MLVGLKSIDTWLLCFVSFLVAVLLLVVYNVADIAVILTLALRVSFADQVNTTESLATSTGRCSMCLRINKVCTLHLYTIQHSHERNYFQFLEEVSLLGQSTIADMHM